jgi:hypothetical protein
LDTAVAWRRIAARSSLRRVVHGMTLCTRNLRHYDGRRSGGSEWRTSRVY